MKPFVSGLVLGCIFTILGGVFVGSTITIGDVESLNPSRHSARYDLRVDESNGICRYSIIDTETGVATIMEGDGKTIVVKPESPTAEK